MNDNEIMEIVEKEKFQLIETHISWLLLGPEFVYKIKKPVKLTFLDFSTLEKRRYFCEEELRLNRRLSPGVYLAVVAITENGIEKKGKQMEYAVKMKRLDEEKKMDHLLREKKVSKSEIREIAAMVADFHGRIEKVEGYCTPEIVWEQISDLSNYRETIEKTCGNGNGVDRLLARCRAFIEKNQGNMRKRISRGMVKDCHGDLHSANIFLDAKPIIIDCIEFSRRFRYIDVASEISFMAMDLDYHGREDLSEIFVQEYVQKTGDRELETLLPLYKCYRANVRAKVAAIDYSQHPADEATERMRRYTKLAERYAEGL